MISTAKALFYRLVFYSGLIYVWRALCNKLFGNPIKLLFSHRVIDPGTPHYPLLKALGHFTIDEFTQKLGHLRRHYRFISMDQCLDYLKKGGQPANCVVLTFDDGYDCFYRNVFPLLKRYRIPAAIYVTHDAIDKRLVMWYDRLMLAVFHAAHETVELGAPVPGLFALRTIDEKVAFYLKIVRELKKMDLPGRDAFLEKAVTLLGVDTAFLNRTCEMLTWNQIIEMAESGLVTVGAHTMTHPIITRIPREDAYREIAQSGIEIGNKIGRKILHFAYPNGDYDGETKRMVERSGFLSGVTIDSKNDLRHPDPFSMGRLGFDHAPYYLFGMNLAVLYGSGEQGYRLTRNMQTWLAGYIKDRGRRLPGPPRRASVKRVVVTLCDHFEPLWPEFDEKTGLRRIKEWCNKYPAIAEPFKDGRTGFPRYSFFYAEEQYRPTYLDRLSDLCRQGFGEIEIHLHHENDSEDELRRKLLNFTERLAGHGALARDKRDGRLRYGFIHGDWALGNSRPDHARCGVDAELPILQETGCYADFTFPSAPDITQPGIVNSIYYAAGDPEKPRAHFKGVPAEKGAGPRSELLLLQGPLLLNWKKRKLGLLPTIENGEIGHDFPVTPARIRLWLQAGVQVLGAPETLFIKLYTHGCQDKNLNYLLNRGLRDLFSMFHAAGKAGGFEPFFLSARETVNVIHDLESGDSDPDLSVARSRPLVQNA